MVITRNWPNQLLLRYNLWNLLLKASPTFNHHMPVLLVFQPLGDKKKPETCGAFLEGGSNEAPAGPSDRLDWEYWAVLLMIGSYVTFSIICLIFERGVSVFILWCFFRHPYQPWHTKSHIPLQTRAVRMSLLFLFHHAIVVMGKPNSFLTFLPSHSLLIVNSFFLKIHRKSSRVLSCSSLTAAWRIPIRVTVLL